MNVFIVYAHPEPQSLNGALRVFTVQHLQAQGHTVQVSDLHAMQWKPVLDAADCPQRDPAWPFQPAQDSRRAFDGGTQAIDIAAEQAKLRWADVVILQFPLWWFSMPAILKGWVDRVYANGFAYGVGEHSDAHWGDRYGEGNMRGKRAMLLVTTGGWAPHYSPRGINGPMEAVLFPIEHGILFYPGFDVLPAHVLYRTGSMGTERFTAETQRLAQRLDGLRTDATLPYRRQNAGDYHIPELTLREGLAPGEEGFGIHLEPAGAADRSVGA
ncbi:MAG: Glutathione-regulated potassium-efflux system ancillary protein KefF [Stenotrophomonas maltophilia]|uniref:Glutathione-regulated potassium-efflux system ancillary protein KefF n=1 Tax=Stenotrophomonas maltophilia TaxID=40324 RepID=A0A7V8FJV7_STEMA|nr:MAG: Glutathione-regulated potassium-efflux system ancillary protein KefF [Stenotrophomonas maltophilia]